MPNTQAPLGVRSKALLWSEGENPVQCVRDALEGVGQSLWEDVGVGWGGCVSKRTEVC